MAKGMVTQSFCILLRDPVSVNQLKDALSEFGECREVPPSESWAFGGPTIIFPLKPNPKGTVVVDIVEQKWPDEMGNPDSNSMVFGAWAMGHFGPFTYPGGLERSVEQCWMWEDGGTTALSHTAFVRVRVGYSFGADNDAPVIPEDYDAIAELNYITGMGAALLKLPGALCYFNPNGEVLHDENLFLEAVNYAEQADLPPLDLWTNVRLFNIDREWVLMDTVGNEQFEGQDCEACFVADKYELEEVNMFLRNLSLLTLNHPEAIEDGMEMQGPNGVMWQLEMAKAVCPAPRPVLRWLPMDETEFPRDKLPTDDERQEPTDENPAVRDPSGED